MGEMKLNWIRILLSKQFLFVATLVLQYGIRDHNDLVHGLVEKHYVDINVIITFFPI